MCSCSDCNADELCVDLSAGNSLTQSIPFFQARQTFIGFSELSGSGFHSLRGLCSFRAALHLFLKLNGTPLRIYYLSGAPERGCS